MDDKKTRSWMTPAEAGEALDQSAQTVIRWYRHRILGLIGKWCGTHHRIDRASVLAARAAMDLTCPSNLPKHESLK